MPNQAVIKEWVESLESGRYEQGEGYLHKGNTYCCLGVLCHMYAQKFNGEWFPLSEHKDIYAFQGRTADLPPKVQEWAGLDAADPEGDDTYRLSELNDGTSDGEEIPGKTFPEIAAIIRERYLGDQHGSS